MDIHTHIEKDRQILGDPMVSSQSRRHVEEELESLERYAASHPDDEHDPTALELYCNDNPEALECKVYDV
jgi:uncharacterized protein YlxP (DUF503 family)